jgi:RNA polymerase sigma factor (sigma-70 family)
LDRNELYSAHEETIEEVIEGVCRRRRLDPDRAADLAQDFRLKIIEEGVLEKFKGHASLRTYLGSVCEHLLHDWRTREWGKWRPCQAARRLGDLAIALDRLLTRDRIPYEEAVEMLVTQGRARSRKELDEIRPQLAPRCGRPMVDAESLEQVVAPGGAADAEVVDQERAALAAKAAAALAQAVRALPPQDQLIVRLEAQLCEAMAALGVNKDEMLDLFDHSALDLPGIFDVTKGNDDPGPSTGSTPGGSNA